MRSAQNACRTTVGHFAMLPSHALMMDLRMVQCLHSTIPFTCELQAEIRMCQSVEEGAESQVESFVAESVVSVA